MAKEFIRQELLKFFGQENSRRAESEAFEFLNMVDLPEGSEPSRFAFVDSPLNQDGHGSKGCGNEWLPLKMSGCH